MHIFLGLVLAISLRCLWVRGSSWPSKWDGPTTRSILMFVINILMMTPEIGLPLSPYLHRAFGVWNLEELFGHICYIGALMGLITANAFRLKLPDSAIQKFLHRNVALAGSFMIPVAVALFFAGRGGGSNIGDLILHRPSLRMYPYWIFLGASSLYLSAVLIWVLKTLRPNPASRLTCDLYLTGCYLSIGSVILGVAALFTPVAARAMWIDIRLESIAFSFAAIVSWQRRVSSLNGSDQRKHGVGA